MEPILLDWVLSYVWIYTGAENTDNSFDTNNSCCQNNVLVYQLVFHQKLKVLLHVCVEPSNFGSKVDDMRGLICNKKV